MRLAYFPTGERGQKLVCGMSARLRLATYLYVLELALFAVVCERRVVQLERMGKSVRKTISERVLYEYCYNYCYF